LSDIKFLIKQFVSTSSYLCLRFVGLPNHTKYFFLSKQKHRTDGFVSVLSLDKM